MKVSQDEVIALIKSLRSCSTRDLEDMLLTLNNIENEEVIKFITVRVINKEEAEQVRKNSKEIVQAELWRRRHEYDEQVFH